VHETYLKLVDQKQIDWQDRAHFIAVAAQLMRRILVDHARKRGANKRQGGVYITLEKLQLPAAGDWDLVALDDGLKALEKLAPDLSRIVELRFFGGLSIEETGEALGVSSGKVKRDWTLARAWLHRETRR
jgi:RNA polymerase sigma factor (TIGR02999 family)